MQHAVLVIFLSAALFHLWFVYRNFARPAGRTIPRSSEQLISRYTSADEPTKILFWLSTAMVLMLAALLQLSPS